MEKNPWFVEAIRREQVMEDILMEIVKDRVDKKINEREQQTTVTHLTDIMKNLKLTLEQAMDALSIPPSQRSIYAGLVGKTAH